MSRAKLQIGHVFDTLQAVGRIRGAERNVVQRSLREDRLIPATGGSASLPQVEIPHVVVSAIGAALYAGEPRRTLADAVREFWHLPTFGPIERYRWSGAATKDLPRTGAAPNACMGEALQAIFESAISSDPEMRAGFRAAFDRITLYPEWQRVTVSYSDRTEVIGAPSMEPPPSGAIISSRALTAPLVFALADIALESREMARLLGTRIETASTFAALNAKPFTPGEPARPKRRSPQRKAASADTLTAGISLRKPPAATRALPSQESDQYAHLSICGQARGGSLNQQETQHASPLQSAAD